MPNFLQAAKTIFSSVCCKSLPFYPNESSTITRAVDTHRNTHTHTHTHTHTYTQYTPNTSPGFNFMPYPQTTSSFLNSHSSISFPCSPLATHSLSHTHTETRTRARTDTDTHTHTHIHTD